MTSEQIQQAVEVAQKPLLEEIAGIKRDRRWLLGTTALAFIVAIVSISYGINREDAFQNQLGTNQVVVCAAAKSTALAPRSEPIGGETRNRYLNRLEAQREQLLVVGELHCPTLPGFATFPFLRAHAIAEIEEILNKLAPGKLRRALEAEKARGPTASTSPTEPPLATTPAVAGGTGGSGHSALPANPPSGPPSHTTKPPPPKSPPHKPPGAPASGNPPAETTTPGTGTGSEGATGGSGETTSPESGDEDEQGDQEKPGLLDPTLGVLCEVTAGVKLCTPR